MRRPKRAVACLTVLARIAPYFLINVCLHEKAGWPSCPPSRINKTKLLWGNRARTDSAGFKIQTVQRDPLRFSLSRFSRPPLPFFCAGPCACIQCNKTMPASKKSRVPGSRSSPMHNNSKITSTSPKAV